jgi:hypothetical protein
MLFIYILGQMELCCLLHHNLISCAGLGTFNFPYRADNFRFKTRVDSTDRR